MSIRAAETNEALPNKIMKTSMAINPLLENLIFISPQFSAQENFMIFLCPGITKKSRRIFGVSKSKAFEHVCNSYASQKAKLSKDFHAIIRKMLLK